MTVWSTRQRRSRIQPARFLIRKVPPASHGHRARTRNIWRARLAFRAPRPAASSRPAVTPRGRTIWSSAPSLRDQRRPSARRPARLIGWVAAQVLDVQAGEQPQTKTSSWLTADHPHRMRAALLDVAGRVAPLLSSPRPHEHMQARSEEHTSELQSRQYLVCRLLLEKKKTLVLTMS